MTYMTLPFSIRKEGAFLTATGPIFWVLMTDPLEIASGLNLPTTSSTLVAAPAWTSSSGTVRTLTIDAAISTSDFAARPELPLKTLAVANEALPQFIRQCVITRGDLIRSKRMQLVAFVAAEMKAYGFALAHRDKVVPLTRRIAGLPPGDPVAEVSYREVVEQRAASPAIEIDLEKLRWLRDLLADDGRMAAKFDPAAVTDSSIREAALMRVNK